MAELIVAGSSGNEHAPLPGVTPAALALVGEASGPFSPIQGLDSMHMCGGVVALQKAYNVDISTVGKVTGAVYEAIDREGHIWFVRCLGSWMVTAFRERTEEEMLEHIEQCNAMYRVDFGADQFRAVRRISFELVEMAHMLTPDKLWSRRERRYYKKRLKNLTDLQQEILLSRRMPMRDIRPRMADLGLPMPLVRH